MPTLAEMRCAACAEVERLPRGRRARARRCVDAPCDVSDVVAEDHELVAAVAHDAVAGRTARAVAVGDLDEQLVADVVAVGVVDRLKWSRSTNSTADWRRVLDGPLDAASRTSSGSDRRFGQAGEAVEHRQLGQLLAGATRRRGSAGTRTRWSRPGSPSSNGMIAVEVRRPRTATTRADGRRPWWTATRS